MNQNPQRLIAGGTTLPTPIKIESSEELIWSSNTGRSTSGEMVGTVIAEKTTVEIEWGVLPEADVKKIQQALSAGFFTFKFYDCGEVTIKVYRGTIKKEHLGYIGDGKYYYKSVTASVIQQ